MCRSKPDVHTTHATTQPPVRATPESISSVRDTTPTELLNAPRWLCWDGTLREDGKLNKTPLNPHTGGNAMSNNPGTWGTFEQAADLALRDERVGGVGAVLTDSTYWALDLDHVIDGKTGELAPAARRFLDSLTPTFTERSPSGTGLHVIFRGSRPTSLTRTTAEHAFGEGKHLEVFGGSSARYLTMTGALWSETNAIVEASQDSIDAVLAMFPPEPSRRSTYTPPPDDLATEERKARRALQKVPSDDYETWIAVGMALKATFPEAVATALWIEWSRKSPKYDEHAIDKHWRSFHDKPGGKSIAYVFWLAKRYEPDWWSRWQEEERQRPDPSVSSGSSSQGHNRGDEGTKNSGPGPSVSSGSAQQGGDRRFLPLRPLPSPLLSVLPFDPSLLPEAFQDWVVDIAERIQCPIDFPAIAAMVTFSSVVGKRLGIRPKQKDDWLVVPNLWGGLVGRPGVMKTPALQEPMGILRGLETEAKREYERLVGEYQAQCLVARARERLVEKEIKEDLADGGDGLGIAKEALAKSPTEPTRQRFLTNDSTVEKLGEILRDNPFGVLVFRDELTGLLRNLDKEGNEGSRSFYLEAWNGTQPFTFDRIGRGTVEIPSAIVSILGGIQPGPLSSYLKTAARAGVGDDGLVQRFQLLVYPDISPRWRNVDRLPDSKAKARAVAAYRAALHLDPHKVGAQQDAPDQIPYLRFTADAQALFDEWRIGLEGTVRTGGEDAAIESHLAKYRGLIPSLALLVHLADGHTGNVELVSVSRALAWAKYLEAHARRVYGLSSGGNTECLAVAKHILNGDLRDGFDTRSVYRPCWTHLDTAEAAEKGIEELVKLGWLAEERRTTPGRSATVFRINPKLWETHPRPTDGTDRSPFSDETDTSREAEQGQEGTDGTDRSTGQHGREGDEWSTPVEILEAARAVLGGIDIDPATNVPAQKRVRATTFYTKEDNGLLHPWRGRLWTNPPYSYPLIEQFMSKLVQEYECGNVTAAIALTNSRTDTKWFHAASAAANAVCLYRGRIRFLRPSGEPGPSPTHAQVLFYFGSAPSTFDREFSRFGRVTISRREGAA